MPYPLSLQAYCLPEFYAVAPDSWETRLREISPILPNLAHLRFRKFEPRDDWYFKDRPMWAVYSCTPRHLIQKDRAEQFALHWSELPSERQKGRKGVVSDYQHFMWHSQGLEVRPFWLLQGEWGGTPTLYTPREKRYLDASGAISEPFPIGFFPACTFDERAVKGIVARDRLVQAGMRYDALEAMDRPAALRAEDELAERTFRETYLDTLAVMQAPAVEYMKSQLFKEESPDYLPPAPAGLANTLATWRDVFVETGKMIGVTTPTHKQVSVSMALTT